MPADTPRHSVPEVLDAWRQVTARREFEGRVPLASLQRLRDMLDQPEGDVVFALDFDRDNLGIPYAGVKASVELPLVCQRTLDRFMLPVEVDQRFGLIRTEAEEAGLPPGYEALLLDESGDLRPLDLIEDELILAVPVVPVSPSSEAVDREWTEGQPVVEPERPNPFAALAALKKPQE